MIHFYCARLTGLGFSIDKWNEDFNKFLQAGILETEEARRVLHPEYYPCEEQCFDCIAVVGARRLATKQLKEGGKQ